MKKILIALLAALVCLSLVACNGNGSETTLGTDDPVVDQTDPETSDTEIETETEEVTDTETLSVSEDNATEFGPINQ